MTFLKPRYCFVAIAWAAPPRPAVAQCGPCEIAILQLTAGTRPLGLAGAYVAGNGPNAVFHNPAQIGSLHGSVASLEWVGGARFGSFATTGSIGSLNLGAGIRLLADGVPGPFGDSIRLGGGALVATGSVARSVRGVWLGASASYVTPELSSGGGVAFDVGAAVRRFGFLFGVSAQNLGRDFTIDGITHELPRRVSLGVAWPGTSLGAYFDLSAVTAVSLERGGAVIPRGAVELSYVPVTGWTFSARAGVRRVVARAGELRESAVTLGGSFELDRVSLDYAFVPAESGGRASHSIGLRIQ